MDSSVLDVWQAASGSPFLPTIAKGSQFFVGFSLVTLGFLLTGLFALSMFTALPIRLQFADKFTSRPDLCEHPGYRIACFNSIRVRTIPSFRRDSLSNDITDSEWCTCSVLSESTSKIPKNDQKNKSRGSVARRSGLYNT